MLGKVPEYLKVESYDVSVAKSDRISTKANVVFLIDGKKIECFGEGNGPVNALDNAIRSNFKKVEKYYNFFSDLKLIPISVENFAEIDAIQMKKLERSNQADSIQSLDHVNIYRGRKND